MLADRHERTTLTAVSTGEKWDVNYVESFDDARASSNRLAAPVILLDRDWPGLEWRVAVETLASSPHRPCVILSSKVSDDYLWDELIRLGGYDIVAKPLGTGEIVRIVRLALAFWRNMASVISSNSKPSLLQKLEGRS